MSESSGQRHWLFNFVLLAAIWGSSFWLLRIASASIAQCLTRYSCSWIAPLVPQVAARQSPEVDYVSGATESSYAFYDAVVEALSKAR